MNIPVYRGKKIDSDECIIGWYSDTLFLCGGDRYGHYISYKKINKMGKEITLQESIDPTTLSIHFSEMRDNQGNKIFASLSEDGKGGDICYTRDYSYGDLQGVAKYKNHSFVIDRKGKAMGISFTSRDIKVIGIQE